MDKIKNLKVGEGIDHAMLKTTILASKSLQRREQSLVEFGNNSKIKESRYQLATSIFESLVRATWAVSDEDAGSRSLEILEQAGNYFDQLLEVNNAAEFKAIYTDLNKLVQYLRIVPTLKLAA